MGKPQLGQKPAEPPSGTESPRQETVEDDISTEGEREEEKLSKPSRDWSITELARTGTESEESESSNLEQPMAGRGNPKKETNGGENELEGINDERGIAKIDSEPTNEESRNPEEEEPQREESEDKSNCGRVSEGGP